MYNILQSFIDLYLNNCTSHSSIHINQYCFDCTNFRHIASCIYHRFVLVNNTNCNCCNNIKKNLYFEIYNTPIPRIYLYYTNNHDTLSYHNRLNYNTTTYQSTHQRPSTQQPIQRPSTQQPIQRPSTQQPIQRPVNRQLFSSQSMRRVINDNNLYLRNYLLDRNNSRYVDDIDVEHKSRYDDDDNTETEHKSRYDDDNTENEHKSRYDDNTETEHKSRYDDDDNTETEHKSRYDDDNTETEHKSRYDDNNLEDISRYDDENDLDHNILLDSFNDISVNSTQSVTLNYLNRHTDIIIFRKPINNNSDDIIDLNCRVCFQEYNDMDIQRKLNCDHIYHQKCIDKWFESNINCPLCRSGHSD
jgi:hypothetical protein